MDPRLSGETPLVSVILVTFNSAEHLRRCVDAIRSQTYSAVELIVVDNASTDESVAIVSEHADQVVRNDSNRGFSAAVNQAIALARGEFVQLVNPDAFLDGQYIARLVKSIEMAGPKFGMVTGKLLQAETARIDSQGIRMTRSGRHLDIGQGEVDDDDDDADYEVFGVSGAAALYRMSFLRDVAIEGEIFDEDFFAYREDADLAWRGQLFGWRALYVADAIAHHVRRVTPDVRRSLPPILNMHSVKNRFLLRWKNQGWYLALRNAVFEIPRDLLVIGAALTIERTSLPALRWLWRNRGRIRAKRRIIQSRRKVGDRELARWFR